jgi:protein subunit release factor A
LEGRGLAFVQAEKASGVSANVTFDPRKLNMGITVEIRAAEGGDDAKLLVQEQFAIYGRIALRRGL